MNELSSEARRFHTKKHLGQNFLVDHQYFETIISSLDLSPKDNVLEIGPGLGFLTQEIASSGATITVVELDIECVEHLKKLELKNVSITHQDFLQYDINQLTSKLNDNQKIKIAGNVPYQITSKIIAKVFGEIDKPSLWINKIDRVVFMVQLEVAQRFVAKVGSKDYSQISLLVNYFSKPSILRIVPASAFYPVPAVNSAIVSFVPHEKPPVSCLNLPLMRKIIKAGFSQRRKMIKNNLSFLAITEDDLENIFEQVKIDPQARAEKLSLQQFAKITDTIHLKLNT